MTKNLRLAIGATVLGLSAVACSSASNQQSTVGAQGFIAGTHDLTFVPTGKRSAAPPLAGPTIKGRRASLAALKGKVVVVNVWASWCAPCRAETPGLEQVYRQYRGRGVAFLGINVRDSKPNAISFARSYNVTYPSLFDSDGSLVSQIRQLPPAAIPTTAVLDRQGRVAARFIAATTPTELEPVLDRLLEEPSPPPSEIERPRA
jgi:thiol-disulfide isomerase/thioredoxin